MPQNHKIKINWLWDMRISEEDVKKILKDEMNPRFFIYAEKLFSRVIDPQRAFKYVSKKTFLQNWPKIKIRIQKDTWAINRVKFWETYVQSLTKQSATKLH